VFPAKNVGLRPVTAEEEQRAREAASDPVHQVGGYAMIYNPGPVECTECGEHSPFFATIADSAVGQKSERDEKKTFTGNCGVQMVFHFCTACSVIAAYHSVD
jgi:hypothetical protein